MSNYFGKTQLSIRAPPNSLILVYSCCASCCLFSSPCEYTAYVIRYSVAVVHHESLTELYRHGTYKRFHLGDSLLFNCLCSDNSWITWSYSHWLENHATNLCKILKTSWFYSVLGGLFDGSDPMPESAFRQSLERVNENGKFLPSSNLMSSVERIPPNDSYFASKRGFYSFILPLPDGFFVLFVGKNKCHFFEVKTEWYLVKTITVVTNSSI